VYSALPTELVALPTPFGLIYLEDWVHVLRFDKAASFGVNKRLAHWPFYSLIVSHQLRVKQLGQGKILEENKLGLY
jgi:hypothetical protein